MARRGLGVVTDQRGVSLIELMVAVALLALISIGVFEVWRGSQVAYLQGSELTELQQSARVAMEQIVRELRLAGYDSCVYVLAGGCTSAFPGATERIPEATASAIRVRMDRNANGNTNDPLEDIRFSYASDEVRRTDQANGNSVALANKISVFTLQYFNRDGNAFDPTTAALRDDIRTIRIVLRAEDTFLGSPLQLNLESTVRLRDR